MAEDLAGDQISLKEDTDLFTGSKRKHAKENSHFQRLAVVVMQWQTLSGPHRGQQVLTPMGAE